MGAGKPFPGAVPALPVRRQLCTQDSPSRVPAQRCHSHELLGEGRTRCWKHTRVQKRSQHSAEIWTRQGPEPTRRRSAHPHLDRAALPQQPCFPTTFCLGRAPFVCFGAMHSPALTHSLLWAPFTCISARHTPTSASKSSFQAARCRGQSSSWDPPPLDMGGPNVLDVALPTAHRDGSRCEHAPLLSLSVSPTSQAGAETIKGLQPRLPSVWTSSSAGKSRPGSSDPLLWAEGH